MLLICLEGKHLFVLLVMICCYFDIFNFCFFFFFNYFLYMLFVIVVCDIYNWIEYFDVMMRYNDKLI